MKRRAFLATVSAAALLVALPLKWALSWLCYWLGDLVSKPMKVFGTSWLYPIYNRLMTWASDLQGEGDGPWQKPEIYETDEYDEPCP